MPGVVFVLGCDPECWLVELNQPAHKLNFQDAFFAGSFNMMVELLPMNLLSIPINFATQKKLKEVHQAQIQQSEAKPRRYCKVNKQRVLQPARMSQRRNGLELKP